LFVASHVITCDHKDYISDRGSQGLSARFN